MARALQDSVEMVTGLAQDIKFTIRVWARNPGMAVTCILILAIGLGASAAVFSLVHALLIKPLPYPNPEKLVVFERISRHGISDALSPLTFQDLTAQSGVFQSSSAYTNEVMTLTGVGEPQRLKAMLVSWNFFQMIQIDPALGRFFEKSEGISGAERVVVLGYSLWQHSFSGDQRIIGRPIQLEGRSYVVIGIAPPNFDYPEHSHVWRPLVFDPHDLEPNQRGANWVQVIGRLQPGISLSLAQNRIDAVAQRLAHDFPRTNENVGFKLYTLQDSLVGSSRKALLVLMVAVLIVVLLACANVTNLLLAQIQKRSNEINIRAALGAQTERLVQQFLVESFLLSLLAGIIGSVLSVFLIDALPLLSASGIPDLDSVQISFPVLLFLFALILVTSILIGLFPALQARNMTFASGRIISEDSQKLRSSLVIGQIALALVLLTSAGLLIRSAGQLMSVDSGFQPENVYTFEISLPEIKYSSSEQIFNFYNQLLEAWNRQPGTEHAAAAFGLPMNNGPSAATSFERIGHREDEDASAGLRVITPDFFRTLQIPLLKGRYFDRTDDANAPGVMIISESLARKYFPNENPLGQMIRPHVTLTEERSKPREIVGIVGDVHYRSLDTKAAPEIYVPLAQTPLAWLEVVVRSRATLPQMNASLKQTLWTLDPALPVPQIYTMVDLIDETLGRRKFLMDLLSGFSATALFLAAFGIYAALSYSIAQRTREIGVRMALGAQSRSILMLVLKKGMVLVCIGATLGIAGAIAGTTILKALLFQVSTTDPLTYAAGVVILCIGCLLAIYLPARRALSIQPLDALRYQ